MTYEDIPKVDLWLKITLGSVLFLTLTLGVFYLFSDIAAASTMFGLTIFDALLFKAIMPRRYQIYSDRVRIVLGGPFALNVPLSDIKWARPARGVRAFKYWGLRFATSANNVVEITRRKGLNIVISPSDRDAFLEQLNRVREGASY